MIGGKACGACIFDGFSGSIRFSKPKGKSMNKSELIEAVAERAELSKAAVNKAIDALTEVITSVIAKGNPVALIGFGTFKSVMRSARTGKNPKTGAVLKIAAKAVPKFSAGAGLKAAVAGKKPVAKKAAPAKKAPAAKKPAAKPAAKKPAAKKK
jgi:DNA-binding protein HU-beta